MNRLLLDLLKHILCHVYDHLLIIILYSHLCKIVCSVDQLYSHLQHESFADDQLENLGTQNLLLGS